MSTVPYFPFYPSDYLADTAHLSTEQHGAYLLMLMTAWPRGGRLPKDPRKLARIARVSPRRWHLICDDIMEFWTAIDDDIVSPRMAKDYQKAVSKSELRSAIGKRGGDAKALKTKKPRVAKATRLLCHSPEPEPEEEKKGTKVPQKKGTRLPENFVLPKDWGEWALSEGMPENRVRYEASQFRDYWIAATGAKASKLDWLATWRNWCRRSLQDRPASPAKPKGFISEQLEDVMQFARDIDERREALGRVDSGPNDKPALPLLPDPDGSECDPDVGGGLDRGLAGSSAESRGDGLHQLAAVIPIQAARAG